MRTAESISLGSSPFPREFRHLAGLTKQRQTSIGDVVREGGPWRVRWGFWKGRGSERGGDGRGLGVAW